MRVEVRGGTGELNGYMGEVADRILQHAAGMHDISVETKLYGQTTIFEADLKLIDVVSAAAGSVDDVKTVVDRDRIGASEDVSYLIRCVQKGGVWQRISVPGPVTCPVITHTDSISTRVPSISALRPW